MTLPAVTSASAEVFVSYSPADERWATWIAWQLEQARYQVMLEAWDRGAGEPVDAFVRRAAQTAALTVVVWSRTFSQSRAGAAWLASRRGRPAELLLVRVDDTPADPAKIGVAELDLVPHTDADAARAALLTRVAAAPVAPDPAWGPRNGVARRFAVPVPRFPPAYAAERARSGSLSVLHLAGPRFPSPEPGASTAGVNLCDEIVGAVDGLTAGDRIPRPDLVVVSGDLMASGKRTQKERAEAFLVELRVRLDIVPERLVVVPGGGDVSAGLCEGYFRDCADDETEPQRPYFRKLRYFAELFGVLYGDLPDPGFISGQPFTLFELPELRVVVAGLNSTMAISHLPEDDYGQIGERQAGHFARVLQRYEADGWLRLGVMRHDPVPARGDESHPTALRDVDLLRRVLGGRLNLLLHGPGTGGESMARLGETMHVVPAAAAGRFELVHLSADGLTRYSPDDPGGYHTTVDWHAAAATFRPVSTPEPPPTMEILEPVLDDRRKLLRSVEDVVRARYPRVTVRQAAADPPYLQITVIEDERASTRMVGAHPGELTAQVVEDFLEFVGNDPAELVHESREPPPTALREYARRRGVVLRSFIEFQGMVDLTGYVARQSVRLRTDERYPPDLYVPQRFRLRNGHTGEVRRDLAGELQRLLTGPEGCFAMVLGDFGRGKSFVLREVTRRITEQERHVVPVLVDLRAVDKASDVRGLLAAHLATHGETTINFKAFDYMLREGRIVLLFDGFDELVTRLTYDRALEHLRVLAAAARDKAKIVVACRTQHFRSHAEIVETLARDAGEAADWRVLEVERFTETEVRDYLRNRYRDDDRADARLELMRRVGEGELVELALNPRMLSFVADLDDASLCAASSETKVLSAAKMFDGILTAWLRHEVERTSGQPGSPVTLRLEDLWRGVEELALRLWRTGERQIRLAELDEVAEALTDLADGRLSVEQTVHAMGSGSLLVRTDQDLFGFIHRSVSDWLVARVLARRLAAGQPRPVEFAAQLLSERAVDFLCDLAPARACLAWSERVAGAEDGAAVERRNAEAVAGRLATPPGADLRFAKLAGEELSYRRFDDVDLTGADLRGARLIGANLRAAVLREAALDGARLDEAQLAGADLTRADLSHATVFGADLAGARLDGSRWRRAALVNCTGVPAAAPDLRGAAIAPGMPVHTQLAPAEVGVRYGFHGDYGRLPQSVAYSPAGDLVAVGNRDGGVLVCDTATGKPVRTLTGHGARVVAVAYGDDVLVTGSRDGTVRVWDADTGDVRHVLDGHVEWTWPVLVDPVDDAVLAGDATGALRVWDRSTGRLRHTLGRGRGALYSLVRCGDVVVAAYRGGVVQLWDTRRGVAAGELTGTTGPVYRVAADPAGELVAAATERAVTVWQLATGRRWDLAGHEGHVYSLAFADGAPRLVSGDSRGVVALWDTTDGSLVHRCAEHGAAIYAAAFSSRGDLVTGDRAGTLLMRDGTTGAVRRTLAGHTGSVWPVVFRPDGGQLAVSDDQFTLRLWDPATGECSHTLTGHAREVTSLHYSPDSTSLAISRNDGMVRIWDPEAGRLRRRIPEEGSGVQRLGRATFAPVGNRLVTVTNDRQLNVRNLDARRVDRNIDVESPPVWAVGFSPSGKVLATANDDDTVRLWYVPTGRLLHTLTPHRGRVRSIAFNADGTLVATGCDDSVVRMFDAHTGALVEQFDGHDSRVYAVEFGDGCLASASWDGTARISPLGGSGRPRVLNGHTGRLWTATFAPDGRTLATAGDDRVVRLWDVRDGVVRHALSGHTGIVAALAFRPDGRQLASGGADGTTRLWSLDGLPAHRLTLLGMPDGWAAVAPDGRYRFAGVVDEAFWYVIGMRRFEIGELDDHLPEVIRLTGADRF